MLLYHFTSPLHLERILSSGRLRTTESNVGAPWREGPYLSGSGAAPDVVWLMDLADPGEAHHGLGGSVMDKKGARITVETRFAIHWADWEPTQWMSPRWREAFLARAGGEEAAEHWYVVPADIRKSLWREVAVKDPVSGAYVPMRESDWR